ncbi:MAG: AraC family transcriptional regulator ligand-binding domain-containing protein [Bacteroidota bacterium]
MKTITSLFPRKVIEEAHPSVNKEALLQTIGLSRHEPVDPARMVPVGEFFGFLERLVRADPLGITIPLRVGAAMRCDDYGAFGLAWKSATTLRGSYDRAERYARVMGNESTYDVELTAEGAYMQLHRFGERQLGMRISNEAHFASIMAISGQVASTSFQPLAVFFKHAAPSTVEHHEAFFGCPVHFGADRDALLVSNETLHTPNKLGDPGLSRFFETHLQAEVEMLGDVVPLDRQVRDHVATQLSEGLPTITDVASHLGMSARTLQRRLGERGLAFQTLVNEARRQLAHRLLKKTDFSLIEVAFMTGYSSQSAFTRAFKRWAGQTPRSYRIQFQLGS